jgi:hypothetical protein
VAALVCVWAKKKVNGCPMEKDRVWVFFFFNESAKLFPGYLEETIIYTKFLNFISQFFF